jgi:hypothetical protein
MIFYAFWNVIRWFMDPVTQEKASPVMYQSGVHEHIPPEHLPPHIGGTLDGEPDIEELQDAPWAFAYDHVDSLKESSK